jgi:hypothetical protein
LIAGALTHTPPVVFRLLLHTFRSDDAVERLRPVVALL